MAGYNIEVRLASKNGYHTPAEAKRYYGRYARDGVTVHWWNTPSAVKDSDHDNICNYILGKASRGEGSVNYVLSNKKITMLVNPDNVAWASQGGNPTTVSIEFSPHLNSEGYKKAGWLINELFNSKNGRYRKAPRLWKHSDWFSTQCPGNLSLSKMLAEANKWATGGYNPKPPTPPKPTPVPPQEPNVTFHLWKEGETEYVANKQPTRLWNVDTKTWEGIKEVTSATLPLKQGSRVTIVGHVHNKALNRDYYITRSSFDGKRPTGFHPADLDVYVPPRPTPKPPETKPEPPVEPTDPVPPSDTVDKNAVIAFLEMIGKLISEFINKLKGNK